MINKLSFFNGRLNLVLPALVILLITCKGFSLISLAYYLFPFIIAAMFMMVSKTKLRELLENRMFVLFLPFIVWALLSSFWSFVPLISFLRGFYFLFLVIATVIFNDFILEKSIKFHLIFFPTAILVILIATFSMILKIPGDYWSGGNGLGLKSYFNHQNTLGSIMIFLLPILNFELLQSFKRVTRNKNELLILLFMNILAGLVLLITFSRGAIFAYLIFCLLFILLYNGWKKAAKILGTITVGIILLMQINFFGNYFSYTIYKGKTSIMDSRGVMYKMSITGAKNGGATGLGYGMSDPKQYDPWLCKMDKGIMVREKGSTVLALIEELGWIGMILFYLPLIYLLYRLISKIKLIKKRDKDNSEKMILGFSIAFLAGLIVHSQVEAWGVGVGSVMLPMYLILLFNNCNIDREF